MSYKRDCYCRFRLNQKEKDKLDSDAARTGLSKASYIRALLMDYSPKELPQMEFYDVLKELRQINNSINQIAAKADGTGSVDYLQYRKDSIALSEVIGKLMHEVFE